MVDMPSKTQILSFSLYHFLDYKKPGIWICLACVTQGSENLFYVFLPPSAHKLISVLETQG